jgi:hypothetical protein
MIKNCKGIEVACKDYPLLQEHKKAFPVAYQARKIRRVSSDVGSMSDQPKAPSPVCGVSGLLFAALLVAVSLVRQSRDLAEPENVYANFYKWGILLVFAAWISP